MSQLSENSSVRLGLVVTALAAVVSCVFAVGWWASALQAKVDSLLMMTSGNVAKEDALEKEIREMNSRLLLLERQKP